MHGFFVDYKDDFISFYFSHPALSGFYGYLSLASAGDMGKSASFTQSRLDWLDRLGLNADSLRCGRQVHGQAVVDAASFSRGREPEADGLVCSDSSLVCGVTVADCMPVWLFREDGKAWGLVHSGWRGTGIAAVLADRLGDGPRLAVLGPSIGSCCYRVDKERARLFSDRFGRDAVVNRGDAFFLDLRAANRALLEERGVYVYAIEDCTCCDERFGSFRREGEGFTHMLALALRR